jgi:hypothetical protein
MTLRSSGPFWIVAMAVVLTPAPAHADQFYAPMQVMAAADGRFSYVFWLRKGPGVSGFGSSSYLGDANVEGSAVVDGFCLDPIEWGETVSFEVNARLLDPAQPGSVFQRIALCHADGGESTTQILPFDPLAVGDRTQRGEAQLWNERRTTFHFRLSEAGHVRLTVHDVAGRWVSRVLDGPQPAGTHSVTWAVPVGEAGAGRGSVLFARLSAGRVQLARRLILLR